MGEKIQKHGNNDGEKMLFTLFFVDDKVVIEEDSDDLSYMRIPLPTVIGLLSSSIHKV